MTAEQHRHNPAAAEQNATAQANLETMVTDLLNNPELHDMTFDDQGKFVVDRFIGATVAAHQRGEFANASTPFQTPADALRGVSSESSMISANGAQVNAGFITRAGGLRGAAQQLAGDPRTSRWVPHLHGRLMEAHGQPRLISLDQVDGYLLGIQPGEYASWKEPISRDIRKSVANKAVPEWKSNTPRHYGSVELQRERSMLRAESDKAQEAGVDLYLLEDATANIQHLNDYYAPSGRSHAPSRKPEDPIIGLPEQTFDHLFQP